MNTQSGKKHRLWRDSPNGLIYTIIGIVLIVLMSLLYFYLLMSPPVSDLGLMTLLLTTTAGISTLVGLMLYRFGWLEHLPAVRWTLLAGYFLSGVLTFFNVFVTAQLMFTDQHDLLLATVLLVFATAIATVIGFFASNIIVDRILLLQDASHNIAQGNFDTRIQITGKDELALLATAFNEMSAQLQQAKITEEESENIRRELIAWVSHDLQTPLSSIQAMVEALADGIVPDEETSRRYLLNIKREVHSLSNLIDDLFQLAQLDAGGLKLEIVPDSLITLVNDVISSQSEIANQRSIKLSAAIEENIDPILMDSLQVGRVLNNLINNAINHTPNGGSIRIIGNKTGSRVIVTVSDTGRGIAKEDLPFVFDQFYRGEKSRSRSTGGAGLGLAIAKGIIEAHGGDIRADSQPGNGTRITFTLPVSHE